MARIKTERAEAMAWNGQEAQVLRAVVPPDPAFSSHYDQMIVKIGGREIYFYGSEVIELSDDERKSLDKQMEEMRESEQKSAQSYQRKMDSFGQYRFGADERPPAGEHGTGGIAPLDVPAHAGATPQQIAAGTSPFNRVPGEPPRTAEQDGGAPESGPGGYPPGSGPDPQGRRVNEKDQSKSNPSERPVPGAQES